MNLATPWTPILLLVVLAVLAHGLRGRLAGWPLPALTGLGLAAVTASLVLLRLSPDTAPAGFPWSPALGSPPRWAADPEMLPFALVVLVLLAGAAFAGGASSARWPSTLLLSAACMGLIFAENLLALGLVWLLMEALTHTLAGEPSPAAATRGARAFDALWGFLGLAGILFLWRATDGASLRVYEASTWTVQTRALLAAVAIVIMGAYPLVSRRMALGFAPLSAVDVSAVFPLIAGLALAERAALLGALPGFGGLTWAGAASALVCGFAAWRSECAGDRLDWAIRAALGLVLMLWGSGAVSPLLLFSGAAASIALGVGLCLARPSAMSSDGSAWRRAAKAAAWVAPVLVLGLGPLSPAAVPMLQLWQRLLDQSLFLPLLLALIGQTLAMAALMRATHDDDASQDTSIAVWMPYSFWVVCAATLALAPRVILLLGGSESSVAGLELPQTLGAWAVLALPVVGVLGVAGPGRLSYGAQVWSERVSGLLSLGWLRSGLRTVATWLGSAIEGLDDLWCGDGALPWAAAFLLILILWWAGK